jgi:hypothetical protein
MCGAGSYAGATQRRDVRMSSTVDLVVAAVFLASACIFLAHAIEAYRRLKSADRKPLTPIETRRR